MSEITASAVGPVAWIAFDADGNRTGLSWDIEDTKFWESRGWSVEPLATAKLTPGRQAEGVTSPCEIDPEGFKKYAAPTTSPEPKTLSSDAISTLQAKSPEAPQSPEPDAVRDALEPFLTFAKDNVVDAEGGYVWGSNIHRESISTWFGPSDFGVLAFFAAALSAPVAGEALTSHKGET